MSTLEGIKELVRELSREELAQFRAWFLEYDWAEWDAELERGARAGCLDALAEQALRDHQRMELNRHLDDLEQEGPVGVLWDEAIDRIRRRER